jgi:MOSC domain-containing protein YiiM
MPETAHGHVVEINIAAEESARCEPVHSLVAEAGKGLVGDRNHNAGGVGEGEAITLIELEALEGLEADTGIRLSAADSRRNVCTSGIGLNDLVGRRFRVGEALCEGVELCEPCNHLAKLNDEFGILRGLVHRGGLRADVLEGGRIAVGDQVAPA